MSSNRLSKPGRSAGRDGSTKSRNEYQPRPLQVYTSDFGAMHDKCQNDLGMRLPIKYKVHKPNCTCSKLQPRLKQQNFEFVEEVEEEGTSEFLNNGSLIVHPDSKGMPCIFHWQRSEDAFSFDDNPRMAEQELLNHIHTISQNKKNSMKINCAACLLEDEPNGFACVSSTSEETMHLVRDWTRHLASQLTISERAADHGDFVVSLPKSILEKLRAKTKMKRGSTPRNNNKTETTTITEEILEHLIQQEVPIPEEREGVEIKLGHHLDSLLYLTAAKEGDSYWLLNGFDNTTKDDEPGIVKLELNIPGGKRNLGETCLQAAIRETKEETSLLWDERWITGEKQNYRNPAEKMNRYYILHPPNSAELMMHEQTGKE